jgi:hypothetical protein
MTLPMPAPPPIDAGSTAGRVILCDVSGSMNGPRIARLREYLGEVWPESRARLAAFANGFRWVESPDRLPSPMGGTNLAHALVEVGKAFPAHVVVISDGEPDHEESALRAAAMLPGSVDVFFVGDDDDLQGRLFMGRLAAAGGGTVHAHDIARGSSMLNDLRDVLALGSPIAPEARP